jgi:hypothetical protein
MGIAGRIIDRCCDVKGFLIHIYPPKTIIQYIILYIVISISSSADKTKKGTAAKLCLEIGHIMPFRQ